MLHRARLVVLPFMTAALLVGPYESARARSDDEPAAPKLADLTGEKDVAALAAKIRALGVVDDPGTADVLLDLIARPNEIVRATVDVALLAMRRPECVERLRVHGLAHADGLVRAHAARICGRLKLASAEPALRKMIEHDELWLARSEAAIACGALFDVEAKAAMLKLLASDPSEKARSGAMDALGSLGPAAVDAVPAIAANLSSERWQLRIAACQALARIGSTDAMEPLVLRLFKEHDAWVWGEITAALQAITHERGGQDDLWWWYRLWDGRPNRPPMPPDREKHREYRFGFVIDASASMGEVFDPSDKTAKFLGQTYSGATKLTIATDEIARVLSNLREQSQFGIVALAPTRSFSDVALVRATTANVDAAKDWLGQLSATGKPDLYRGLRAVLSLNDSPEENPDFCDTVEVVTLETDAMSSVGDIGAEALVEWYTARNRYARIWTEVFVYGRNGGNLEWLRALAEKNHGRFVVRTQRER